MPWLLRVSTLARVTGADPDLVRSFYLSLGGHFFLLIAIVLWGLIAPRPTFITLGPAYMVDLLTPADGSAVLNVGPLAARPEPKPVAKPKPPPKPVAKPEPPPKPVAKPKPEPPPKPVVKPAPKPEPPPKPVAKPTPKPEPKPVAKPSPAPEPAAKPAAKPEPAPVRPEPKPQPSTAPERVAPGRTVEGAPSGSETIGSGARPGAGSPQAYPAEFVAYANYMKRSLRGQWVWGGEPDPNLAVTVRFRILPDGTVDGARVSRTSLNIRFDQSVLNAVRSVERLAPPPPCCTSAFADVEVEFRASEAN